MREREANGRPGASRRRALRLVAGGIACLGLAAGRAHAAPGGTAYLVGKFLVATPRMRDPRFAETVIIMLRHDRTGAMGVVINRLAGLRPLAEVLDWLGIEADDTGGEIPVHWGGPVGLDRGMVLHGNDYRRPSTKIVTDTVAFTAEAQVLRDIAAGKGPVPRLFAVGYAGWAAGQLEAEMAGEGWITVPADTALLFDDDHAGKWRRAIDRQGIDL